MTISFLLDLLKDIGHRLSSVSKSKVTYTLKPKCVIIYIRDDNHFMVIPFRFISNEDYIRTKIEKFISSRY